MATGERFFGIHLGSELAKPSPYFQSCDRACEDPRGAPSELARKVMANRLAQDKLRQRQA